MDTRIRSLVLSISLPLLLTACGGGDSSSAPVAGPASGSATTGPSTVKVGPITGFGSVFVDGERFETSGANYRKDDDEVDEDDLEIGMIVKVRASSKNSAGEWIADDVEFDEELKGPVDSVGTDSLVAMGQTILVSADTYFDDGISLADIDQGDIVEVSGYRNENDEIEALFIEEKSLGEVDEYEVLGQIRDLDTSAQTFRIGGLLVDYSGAELDDLGSGLANGRLVEVEDETRAYMAGDLALNATEVEGEYRVEFKDEDDDDLDGDGISDSDDDSDSDSDREFEIKGLVTEVINDVRFFIGSIEVEHNSSTEFSGGAAEDIEPGVRLEVEGNLLEGRLLAEEIEFEDNEARVSGIINSVGDTSIVVLGVAVDLTSAELEDSIGDDDALSIDDLMAGDFVDVEGMERNGTIVAEELERDEEDESGLRGTVESFDETAGTLTILEQTIVTDGSTRYEGYDDESLTAEAFFDRLYAGQSVVDVDWDSAQMDTLSPAKELSLED